MAKGICNSNSSSDCLCRYSLRAGFVGHWTDCFGIRTLSDTPLSSFFKQNTWNFFKSQSFAGINNKKPDVAAIINLNRVAQIIYSDFIRIRFGERVW
jgi:hypothetical protein